MKHSLLAAAFLLALGALGSHSAQAQPSTGGPTPAPAASVPLDGGASLLAISGVAYGLRYLRKRRQQA